MRPLFHPQLVNDRFGNPVLYVDCLFERRALLFDLGGYPETAPALPSPAKRACST